MCPLGQGEPLKLKPSGDNDYGWITSCKLIKLRERQKYREQEMKERISGQYQVI